MTLSAQGPQNFYLEVPKLLANIKNGLFHLQHELGARQIHQTIDSVHSLFKGTASMGLRAIAEIANTLEDYLTAIDTGDLVVDAELGALFSEAYELLEQPLLAQLKTGGFEQQQVREKASLLWPKLEAKLIESLRKNGGELSPSGDSTADAVSSLFKIDVAQEIQRLKGIILSPQHSNESITSDSELESYLLADFSAEISGQTELQRHSYQFFLEEAPELLALIDAGLEKVIQGRSPQDIHEIARAAHSLKGGARSSGLEDLGNIALRVEKSFKALQNEEIPLDGEIETYLHQIYRPLRDSLQARLEGRDWDERGELDRANGLWAEFAAQYGPQLAKSEEYLPSSQDLGVDLTASLFEVDVAEGIAAIRAAAASSPEALRETLSAQIEVFSGLGEMLSLPGFCQICQAAGEALSRAPEKIQEISECFLDNIESARAAVLAGDRALGGEPGEALASLARGEGEAEAPVEVDNQGYSFFVEEAPELLQVIESGLLDLKQERTTAKVHEIMRAAHSLKGGAASVGLEAIKTIAHKLEDVFKALYREEVEIDTELETWLLEGYDCLRNPLMEQIETGTYQPARALRDAEAVWQKITAKLGAALERGDDYIPSSQDLGVDIIQSMFAVDVEQELQRLRQVIASPGDRPLIGELRATLEVFSGFGEMLALPGFQEIARQGLKAIANYPERILEIINLIVEDVGAARGQVLEGDRASGGQPSARLSRLAQGNLPPEEEEEIPSLEEVFGGGANEGGAAESTEIPSLDEALAQFNFLAEGDLIWDYEGEIPDVPTITELFGEHKPARESKLEGTREGGAAGDDAPSLDEVFDLQLDGELLAPYPQELAGEEDEPTPSLEEVFGSENLIGAEIAAPDAETEGESQETYPSLEEVFGGPNLAPPPADGTGEAIRAPENLQDAIESIPHIYYQLPGLGGDFVEKGTLSPSETQLQSPETTVHLEQTIIDAKKTASPPTPKTNLTIRVDLDRLERMNNLIGELAINRNGLSLQNDKLQNSVKELSGRFAHFRSMAGSLRDISDRLLVQDSSSTDKGCLVSTKASLVSTLPLPAEIDLNSAFDSLEMDSYDSLYSLVQGLMEQMIQLEEAVEDIALFARQSEQSVESQRQMLNNMRDELMWARMLPIGEVLNRFPRVLRDLCVKHDKKVNLKLTGTDVLIDKSALEKLYDPLVHLIRNSFDHGIETAPVRRQRGKPEVGNIEVKAYHQGNQTIVEVRDDGNGLNLEKIGRKAIARGILAPEQLAVSSQENLVNLIFEPGFSTASQVSDISGRGVGLDIVRSQLRALKGNISVDTTPGAGTVFTLKLPLSLTIDKLLVLLVDSRLYALPADNIEEILVPESDQIKTSSNQRFLYHESQVIPIYPLADLLHYNCYLPESTLTQSVNTLPMPEDWSSPLLLIRQGQTLLAIEVETLVSEQELVIKPFSQALTPPPYTYGCTILGDGTSIPVVNTAILLEKFLASSQQGSAIAQAGFTARTAPPSEEESGPITGFFQVPSVLVVDDSAAMRRTLALSLEKAGYRVIQARDGKEALEQLNQNSKMNLVICDIEMPNMNGFEFLAQRRRNPEIAKVPVAMLTSRSNDKHRQLATHLGADAYFTKPYIEQKFLAAIRQLIEQNSSAIV